MFKNDMFNDDEMTSKKIHERFRLCAQLSFWFIIQNIINSIMDVFMVKQAVTPIKIIQNVVNSESLQCSPFICCSTL